MSNPPPRILGISEAAGLRSVGVAGILTAFRLSVQSNRNTVGITWTFVFTRNAKARSLQPFSSAALTVCFWIRAQSQVDSIVFQRPAVFIKNLLSRYLVNHVL